MLSMNDINKNENETEILKIAGCPGISTETCSILIVAILKKCSWKKLKGKFLIIESLDNGKEKT